MLFRCTSCICNRSQISLETLLYFLMHCRVIFNWLSLLEMWLAYVLSGSFLEYDFVHALCHKPLISLWIPISLLENWAVLCVCVCAEEWILNENSPMWFSWTAGRVTFEPAYDALILHMNRQQTPRLRLHLFVWLSFISLFTIRWKPSIIWVLCSRCLFGDCGLCSVCYWEWNQCRGSMYFKW